MGFTSWQRSQGVQEAGAPQFTGLWDGVAGGVGQREAAKGIEEALVGRAPVNFLAPVIAGGIDFSHLLLHTRVPRTQGQGPLESGGEGRGPRGGWVLDSHLPPQPQNVGGGP